MKWLRLKKCWLNLEQVQLVVDGLPAEPGQRRLVLWLAGTDDVKELTDPADIKTITDALEDNVDGII